MGLAIEKEVYPSPSDPRPAMFEPLATKIEQFITRAIRVIASTFVIAAVGIIVYILRRSS